ncbi:DUF1217 domain-containing protein [Rhodobacter ferrooxidans]|nr:DUF1217 domain-containing protein [Rhodobacter sp. SW2]
MTTQKAAFAAVSTSKREEEYFRANIGKIKTAEALVSDRKLLKVALGAFGLDADINSKAFIQKVLEGGTLKTGALANKLADKQYQAFSAGFGFGDFATPRTQLSTFADEILTAYKNRQFETAVGEQNDDMRLAMNVERELVTLAGKSTTEDAKWFTVMGSKPLRAVFEKAFGLPSSLAALDLDQQLSVFKSAANKAFGATSVSQFADTTKLDKLVKQFLIRSEVAAGMTSTSGASNALQLLQAMQGN